MKNKKGFTLVELLAVIVILGILLVVAVPAVNSILTKSKQKAAKDDALMIIKAIETCQTMDAMEGGGCTAAKVKGYYEGTAELAEVGSSDATCGFEAYKITTNNKIVCLKKGKSITEWRNGVNNADFAASTIKVN